MISSTSTLYGASPFNNPINIHIIMVIFATIMANEVNIIILLSNYMLIVQYIYILRHINNDESVSIDFKANNKYISYYCCATICQITIHAIVATNNIGIAGSTKIRNNKVNKQTKPSFIYI